MATKIRDYICSISEKPRKCRYFSHKKKQYVFVYFDVLYVLIDFNSWLELPFER